MVQLLSIAKVTSLALVNSVNPCQIAMLVLVLVAIMTQNPDKKRKLLFSGLAFVLSVYIGYLFYGLVLVQLFQTFATTLKAGSIYLMYAIAILSMVFGALQIKDFFVYKRGSFGTEMPLVLRPKAKKFIGRITSPFGAFLTGFIITLFLGPCTMAPLVVLTESLSQYGLIGALPYLMYFDLIVVLPLIVITFIVYKGFSTPENVSRWKENNVRILHLIAGLLLFGIGLAVLMGWL